VAGVCLPFSYHYRVVVSCRVVEFRRLSRVQVGVRFRSARRRWEIAYLNLLRSEGKERVEK